MAQGHRRRLVIPAAGNGRRFAEKGYLRPKPFVEIDSVPMIELVVRNMRACLGPVPALIVLRPDMRMEAGFLAGRLEDVAFDFEVDPSGTAATLLEVLSRRVDPDEEIVIANSDQIVRFDGGRFWNEATGSAGTILTFECPQRETKWSYAEVDDDGSLVRVAEKVPISTHATVGVYRFASRRGLTDAISRMMAADDRTNGEFYLCPAYNYLERAELTAPRLVEVERMWGLGTPEDLEASTADPALGAYLRSLVG